MNKKIIVLTGPTASGKTNLAIKLAKKINAQIICADSRIVYKDFDIVSAKPTPEQRCGIKHHLIDIIDANQDFSAGDFVKKANEIIDESSYDIIISGGSWFYIKSLLDEKELVKCPSNKALRESLSKLSNEDLWQKLYELDFKRAQLIHPNNKEKVIRSIELCKYLNMPLSEYKRCNNKNYSAKWYMTNIERELLYERINQRVDLMMDMGLYQEWERNKEKYPLSKIMKNTIGYSEFFDYEDINLAVEKIKQHTRNFAKRQLTYFRNRSDIKLINSIDDIEI